MEAFKDEDTQPIDVEALERAATDDGISVSRVHTRRRKSTYNGLSLFETVADLPPGTNLIGPKGQRGYIAGHTEGGLVLFELIDGYGSDQRHITVEMKPEHFAGWSTTGGVTL